MYPVSNLTKNWLRARNREFVVMATVNDVEYHDGVLIDFSIENSLSLSDELELGTVIPNKLTIRFRTRQEFASNARIIPYIALSSEGVTWQEADFAWQDADFAWEGGSAEWLPLGEFYVDNRTEDRGVWTYTCYDKLVFADVPYISQLTYPTTMQAVWDEICDRLGFDYDSSVEIDPSYIINAGPTGYSCRQVMEFIASANSACAYLGKDGLLKFKKITAASTPVFEMTEADYIRAKQTNPLKTYSRVVVVYDVDDGLYYEAGSGDDSQTIFIDNPFGTQQMADDILAEINGFSYTPISMPARGFPQLDQGDIISFETIESMSWEDADISWQDADFRWDGRVGYQSIILHQVLDFKGGLAMQIEAPSVSEQQSEFQVEGTLEGQINRLNKNAVRFDKPYFGVTHTREQGILVAREDQYSKLAINSDIFLDWWINGERKFYYDEQADAIKFSGVIEASEFIGGSITGSLIQTRPVGEYPRIELSSTQQMLEASADPFNKIRLEAWNNDTPVIIFQGANSATFLTQVGNTLNLINDDYIHIFANKGLSLSAQFGYINVDGWGNFRSSETGQTLQTALNSKANAFDGLTTGVQAGAFILHFTNGILTNVSVPS